MGRLFVEYQGKPIEEIKSHLFFELIGSPELSALIEDCFFSFQKRYFSRGLFWVEVELLFDYGPSRS
jgi:hypothetical protein